MTDYSKNDGTIVPVSSYFFERIEEDTVSLERAVVKVVFNAVRSGTDVIIVPAHHTKAHAEHWSVVAIHCKARCMVHVNSLRNDQTWTYIFRVLLSFIELVMKSAGRDFRYREWIVILWRHICPCSKTV